MRAPVDTITAPPLPPRLPWINSAALRMDQQVGRPVLVEFWDFCRVNSLRTLPYVREWHRRYAERGLRVIGVHSPGFPPSVPEAAVREAVERLGVEHPVVVDSELEIWRIYENAGWPARYLFDQRSVLFEFHYGEGAYDETERAIQELLGIEEPLVPPLRPEDAPGVLLPAQTADQPGAYSGPYEAGAVWAVLDGAGTITVNGRALEVAGAGCHPLVEHPHHTVSTLELDIGEGLECLAVCFTPGVPAPESASPEATGTAAPV